MNALVTHSTLLFIEYVDTIKPNISIPDFRIETLYFFRFFKEQTAYWSKNQSEANALGSVFLLSLILRPSLFHSSTSNKELVEVNGIEPMTSCLQSTRSPN
jgi:hypothetical protein